MLANTKGQGLMEHLKATANVGRAMALHLGLSKELVDRIYAACLLHDIGKAVSSFQKFITSTYDTTDLIVDEDFQDPIIGFPLHHEISWAYLTQKTGDDRILNAVYWHHARPIHDGEKNKTSYDSADQIMLCMDAKDQTMLNGLWAILLPLISTSFLGNLKYGNIDVPDLFQRDGSLNNDFNAESMLLRACVISADRYVSSLDVSSVVELSNNTVSAGEAVKVMQVGGIQGKVVAPKDYDQKRFEIQQDIVTAAGDDRTVIVKAPAGLGKTLIGILWSKVRTGKVLWVCPRNAVADAVYENIVKEIGVLNMSCTVELYRTGKRMKTNIENGRNEFDSDIIVTNIDAIMSPMVNNKIAGRLFTVYGSHVVLDEFHEFVSDAPLFAAFITYMRARHRLADNCKTLLLSATPSLVHILWDIKGERETRILPNETGHYAPQHTGVYQVTFGVKFPASTPGSLLVCNSVSEAQKNYTIGGYKHIIHHRYTDKDRAKIETTIKGLFGKGMTGVVEGESLSAALVVQAAMDISFRTLYDSACSPESTLQRIGRIDRWGTFQSMQPSLTFMDMSGEKTEAGAIRTVYDKNLQSLWYVFLKQELTGISQVNLIQMYEIYNKFLKVYHKEVRDYLIEQYRAGMNGIDKKREFLALIGFYPIKVLNTDPDQKNKVSCRSLRSPDGSYFYTVELVGQPNVWLSPENVLSEGHELYSRYVGNNILNLGLLTTGAMLTRLKGLVACGYKAWTRHSKGKVKIPDNITKWFRKARDPETPLPDFSRKYDPILGVKK